LNDKDKSFGGGRIVCGLAFDNEDNHKRITTGENFYIIGGSEKTHGNLVDTILEFNAVVRKYGKKLNDLTEAEYYDIVKEIGSDDKKVYWFYHS
jgi:hypothetical protein